MPVSRATVRLRVGPDDQPPPTQLFRADPPPAVSVVASDPVDTPGPTAHFAAVSKKPSKVEESAVPYTAKKPVKAAAPASPAGPRFADLEKVRSGNAKLVQVHRKVLQKLAQ